DRARSADLIERVEAAIGATRAQAVRQRLCRVSEQRTGQTGGGISEVGMVEDVEELSPETKPHFLGDAKRPLQPDIRLSSVETSQHVASEIALLTAGKRSECRLVE